MTTNGEAFIEVTRHGTGEKVTVNVRHIVTVSTEVDPNLNHKQDPYTAIALDGTSVVRVRATESYDEVRRLIGLGWLRCGESFQGDLCDRRLDEDGRCPVHGQVGA